MPADADPGNRWGPHTHVMRAETLVLLDEDPQAVEARRAARSARDLPSEDVEQRIVEDAVVSTWPQDPTRRAQIARLNLNLLNYGRGQAQSDAKDVEELGRRYSNKTGWGHWRFNVRVAITAKWRALGSRSARHCAFDQGLDHD